MFDVEGVGKWHVDLKTGSGSVGKGEPEKKADCTITINQENFLKMFNSKLSFIAFLDFMGHDLYFFFKSKQLLLAYWNFRKKELLLVYFGNIEHFIY